MKKSSLFEPQRQSIFAIILILIKFFRIMVRQLWPLLLVLVFNRGDKFQTYVGIAVLAVSAISLIGSVVAYFKFYYYVEGDQLHIEKGLLQKTSLNLPFSRIQTVDFEQNIVHQALKVVRVNIDSAGSKGSEISFDALDFDQANELRDYILEQKAEQEGTEREDLETAPATGKLIMSLSPADLVRIGVSQNHLRTAGILFAAAWALLDNIGQALDRNIYEEVVDQADRWIAISIVFWASAMILFLIVSVLITLVRTVFRYYDLSFYKTPSGFKLISGLLTRKEQTAQKSKIQIISWSTNPIRKLFGMYQMRLYQAASVEVLGSKGITVPGCFQHQVDSTIASVMPQAHEVDYEIHDIHPLARFRFILFAGVLPCAAFTVLSLATSNYSLLLCWLYFPVSVWMGFQYYRKRKMHLEVDHLIATGGIFGFSARILEIYKIQSVKVSQSFYQWRKDLATVTLYTASGDVSIPFLPLAKAKQVRDYILYRVESDQRDWM